MKNLNNYSFGIQLFVWSLRREVIRFKRKTHDDQLLERSLIIANTPEIHNLVKDIIYAIAVSAREYIDIHAVCCGKLSTDEQALAECLFVENLDDLDVMLMPTGAKYVNKLLSKVASTLKGAGYHLYEKSHCDTTAIDKASFAVGSFSLEESFKKLAVHPSLSSLLVH